MTETTSRPEPPQFDPHVPNVARMYDYFLGGKDNFAADREAAEMALSVAPEMRVGALEVRKFLTRGVTFLVGEGIRQFVDIGCGLPTQGNVHEVAQGIAPDCKVAYVDNDPIVVAHGRALLDENAFTTVIQADLRAPDDLLAEPSLRALINFDEPVAILLVAVLHVIPGDELVTHIVTRLRDEMAPGSYLTICHAVSDLRPEVTARLAALYQDKMDTGGPRRMNLRSKTEVEAYFDGLELVDPGVAYLPEWRPDPSQPGVGDTPVWSVGGIGLKR
jgi:hypothetical protein